MPRNLKEPVVPDCNGLSCRPVGFECLKYVRVRLLFDNIYVPIIAPESLTKTIPPKSYLALKQFAVNEMITK